MEYGALDAVVECRPSVTVVRVTGELDVRGQDALADLVTTVADGVPVALDLRAVSFVDVAGLRALLAAQEALGGSRVWVVSAPGCVLRMLEMTGWRNRLRLAEDEEQVGSAH